MAEMMAQKYVEIDGSVLEGGGQILRNSAAFSCLLNQPIMVKNIRANRSSPGLRPQHLTGLQLIESICGGKLEGGNVGSTEIRFTPGKVKTGSYEADTHTAGSICLLMQAALPCFIVADGVAKLRLVGGTNADMAPQIDYALMVFQPIAAKFGMKFDGGIHRRGFFPKGGGEVHLQAYPSKCLKAVNMTKRGNVKRIHGLAYVAGVIPIKVARTMAHTAQTTIRKEYRDVPIEIKEVKEPTGAAVGSGTGIIVIAETDEGCILAGSALGKKGKPAEQVGHEAGEMLLNNLFNGGCVDEFAQDQIILLMALAEGKSEVLCGPLSLHTETCIHIAKLLTKAKFEVKELTKNSTLIHCEGIGLQNLNV